MKTATRNGITNSKSNSEFSDTRQDCAVLLSWVTTLASDANMYDQKEHTYITNVIDDSVYLNLTVWFIL
jgi:hypothetical protein